MLSFSLTHMQNLNMKISLRVMAVKVSKFAFAMTALLLNIRLIEVYLTLLKFKIILPRLIRNTSQISSLQIFVLHVAS